ncbi:hypothetical protein MMS06_18360, partial [Escherichia coli]|nr:hypothetical protein [Escherichia coli]
MVVFFLKIPNLDFAVYLRPFYVPYMPHRYPAAKINKMPKGSVPALQQEMLRRVSKRYDDVEVNRPGFPGECFICELRLPDHRFRWKHNKLFLLL